MSWWNGSVWGALAAALGESDRELERREMEQVTPTYPGIIGSDQCANCSRLVSDLEAARIDLRLATGFNEQYVKQLDAAHEQIETLQQLVNEQSETIRQLREQRDCNKDLRMDRGIYRADGFDTGSGD